jgi:hypothetical protein
MHKITHKITPASDDVELQSDEDGELQSNGELQCDAQMCPVRGVMTGPLLQNLIGKFGERNRELVPNLHPSLLNPSFESGVLFHEWASVLASGTLHSLSQNIVRNLEMQAPMFMHYSLEVSAGWACTVCMPPGQDGCMQQIESKCVAEHVRSPSHLRFAMRAAMVQLLHAEASFQRGAYDEHMRAADVTLESSNGAAAAALHCLVQQCRQVGIGHKIVEFLDNNPRLDCQVFACVITTFDRVRLGQLSTVMDIHRSEQDAVHSRIGMQKMYCDKLRLLFPFGRSRPVYAKRIRLFK